MKLDLDALAVSVGNNRGTSARIRSASLATSKGVTLVFHRCPPMKVSNTFFQAPAPDHFCLRSGWFVFKIGRIPRWRSGMGRTNSVRCVCSMVVASGVFLMARGVSAGNDSIEDSLSAQRTACAQRMEMLGLQIQSVTIWSGIFMLAGAGVAGVGSACAGFLKGSRARKVAAVVGALGAFISVLPKILPAKEDMLATRFAADKHSTLGNKVLNQIMLARSDELTIEAKKYASARFSDCVAMAPPADVPDLPRFAQIEIVKGQAFSNPDTGKKIEDLVLKPTTKEAAAAKIK